MLIYIIIAILMFGVLIAVHEWGHFIAARRMGVQVNEFSIGMGPVIFKRQGEETLYSLRAFPIGGFCAMEGEDEDTENPRSFLKKPVWRKLVILIAGPFMNLVVGFLIVLVLAMMSPVLTSPQIESLEPQMNTTGEGQLLPGDRFLSIDGRKVTTVSDVHTYFALAEATEMDIVVERDGEQVQLYDFTLIPYSYVDESGAESSRYGINFIKLPVTAALILKQSLETTGFYARSVWLGLQMIVSGDAGVSDLAGPVGIVSLIGEVGTSAQSISRGLQTVCSIIALVSVNLAIMNLLPIPALDGGRILLILVSAAYHGITKRKLNPKIELYLNGACMALLMLLMVLVTFQDVWRLVM